MEQLNRHIETLIFASEQPINTKEIQVCLFEAFETKVKSAEIEKAVEELISKYSDPDYSFEIMEIGGGFQFFSKASYHHVVNALIKQKAKRKLSRAALETLSIIAYKQPITKSEMENIRGVSCDYSIQKLLEKNLIQILGRSEQAGRPLIYGTSEKFMDHFGLKSIKDLPKLKDFKTNDNEIGDVEANESAAAIPENEALADGSEQE